MADPNDLLGQLLMGQGAPGPQAQPQSQQLGAMLMLKGSSGVPSTDDVVEASRQAFIDAQNRPTPQPGTPYLGMGASEAGEPLSGGRISQRNPTAVRATEDPLTQNLLSSTDVLKQYPEHANKIGALLMGYPGTTPEMREMNPGERIDAFRGQVKDNLLDTWDRMSPEQRAYYGQWYFGANRMAQGAAEKYGIPLEAAAGNYAALSPQMDWNLNAHLGDRVLSILDQNPRADAGMQTFAQGQQAAGSRAWGDPAVSEAIRRFDGKRLADLSPEDQAVFMRLHDEVHGPKEFRAVLPSGDRGDVIANQGGEPRKPGWANFLNIEKAIAAASSGGDMGVINRTMGNAQKVRSFYNDIVNPPLANQMGDATIDTHQIAGGLMYPLGGQHPWAGQGMGSAGPGSAVSGIHGLYPIYADATRMAAHERGAPVLAMQSVPWEGTRSLFPPEWRTNANRDAVEQVLRASAAHQITPQQARDQIHQMSGGIRLPQPPPGAY